MSCITYPAQPGRPYIPDRIENRPVFGWNAGANSVATIDGDVVLRFSAAPAVGAVLGIGPRVIPATAMERITHGFYISKAAGAGRWQVIEAGVTLTPPRPFMADDAFRLERVSGVVSFFYNNVLVRTSQRTSTGPVVAATSLFASDDTVP